MKEYPVNYEIVKSYYHLEEYNILIFQKKFNYNNFDGARFNQPKKICNECCYENQFKYLFFFFLKTIIFIY